MLNETSNDLTSVGVGSVTFDAVTHELNRLTFKENFSKIKRPTDTKIIGGGPLYPIPGPNEGSIEDLDNSCLAYKKSFKKRLQNVWT